MPPGFPCGKADRSARVSAYVGPGCCEPDVSHTVAVVVSQAYAHAEWSSDVESTILGRTRAAGAPARA